MNEEQRTIEQIIIELINILKIPRGFLVHQSYPFSYPLIKYIEHEKLDLNFRDYSKRRRWKMPKWNSEHRKKLAHLANEFAIIKPRTNLGKYYNNLFIQRVPAFQQR